MYFFPTSFSLICNILTKAQSKNCHNSQAFENISFCMLLLIYRPSFTNIQILDETHLGVVRGLQQEDKESSSQRRNYAWLEQTVLCASARSSVCRLADLYHISYFRGTIYHIVFSPVVGVLEFRLRTWNMTFLEMESGQSVSRFVFGVASTLG